MKKSVFIILFYTLIANVTVAQTPPSNAELTTLVNQAFTNYPRLREQEIAVENASLRVDIVRGQYLPTVSADGSIRYIDPVAEASFGAPGQEQILRFQPKDNYNAQIGANGLIFDFGKTKAQVDKALAEAKLSQDNLAQFRGMIAYQVAQIYYGILFSKKSIEVQQSQIGALEDNRQQVEIRVKNGDALELDLLNANVALENARNRLTDLQAQLEKQQILLHLFTGNDGSAITTQSFDFQNITTEVSALAAAAQNTDFELLLANDRIQIAENDIRYTRKFLFPTLSYNGSVGFRNGYQPDIDQFRFNYALGIGLSYPLYVGGRDRKQLRISELTLNSARATLEATRQNLESDLSQTMADVRANQRKLENVSTVIGQAQSALDITRSRFRNGIATNTDVLTAQANLEQAQLSQIQYQYQLTLSKLTLSRLQGVRFW